MKRSCALFTGVQTCALPIYMGCKVTVIEVVVRILPAEDEEISAFAQKQFVKQGITIKTGVKVAGLEKAGQGAKATIEVGGKSETIEVEKVILAVGIVGNVKDQIGRASCRAGVWQYV